MSDVIASERSERSNLRQIASALFVCWPRNDMKWCSVSSRCSQKGFTFVEILMTLAIIAILFVPIMQLFSDSLYATTQSLDMITATNLAKTYMERTINLNMTKSQLREKGEEYIPELKEAPFLMNGSKWRVKREVIQGTNPLEVRIHVYHEEDIVKVTSAKDVQKNVESGKAVQGEQKPVRAVVTLVTLIEDMMWGTVKQGLESEIE